MDQTARLSSVQYRTPPPRLPMGVLSPAPVECLFACARAAQLVAMDIIARARTESSRYFAGMTDDGFFFITLAGLGWMELLGLHELQPVIRECDRPWLWSS